MPPPKPKRRAKELTSIHRLQPHSEEAERGVLGCILMQPELIDSCRSIFRHDNPFYDHRHQEIFNTFKQMADARQAINLITVHEQLKNRKRLEEVGGIPYISALSDEIPSTANLPSYLGIVKEKYERRKIIQACTRLITDAYDFDGDHTEFLWAAQSQVSNLFNDGEAQEEQWGVQELNAFDPDKDSNAVIGLKDGRTTRFLCRGHAAWIIGPSGIGKSSLVQQVAFYWALGKPVFNIAPVRALRVLIVQAENDKGDAAEMTQGILRSLGIDEFNQSDLYEQLRENVTVLTERRTIGAQFCKWLGKKIQQHRADLVFVDPFLSFAGVDVARQDQCTKFLRQELNPVLIDTGAVLLAAHHTGKPKDKKFMKDWTATDFAYAGIGSSELVNWARAVMVMMPMDGIHYELKLAKRGWRAGARHPGDNGEYTTSIFLKHATDRIFWEQVAAPEEQPQQDKTERKTTPKKSKIAEIVGSNLHGVISKCPPEGESASSLGQRFHAWSIKNGTPLGLTKCRTDLLYALASDDCQKLRYDETTQLWFKGKNA